MASFQVARPMEDFFINPTLHMDPPTRRPSTMVDDNQLSTAAVAHNDVYMISPKGKSPAKQAASIVDLVNEPVFWHGYTSEEEVASPVDDDDDDDDDDEFSLHSDESMDSIASNASFPEQLAEACSNVKQQCNKAQAVKIQAAGKARVVSLPKPIDIPARRSIVRPASSGSHSKRASLERRSPVESTRNSEDSQTTRNDSIDSSVNSPASTAPSSVDEPLERRPPIKHQQSSSRHVDLMEAAKACSSPISGPNSPMFPQSSGLPKRHSTALSDRSDVASIITRSSVRRMTKLSSNFSLNKIGKNLVGRDSSYGGELESVKEPEPNYIAPAQQHRVPARSTSLKPKMVARAANERAPPITLPPFPDDEESNDWPLRRAPGAQSRPRSMTTKLTHIAQVS